MGLLAPDDLERCAAYIQLHFVCCVSDISTSILPLQNVHEAIKRTNIDPKVQDILEQMHAYDNIPRKKSKFQVCHSLKWVFPNQYVLKPSTWSCLSRGVFNKTLMFIGFFCT